MGRVAYSLCVGYSLYFLFTPPSVGPLGGLLKKEDVQRREVAPGRLLYAPSCCTALQAAVLHESGLPAALFL